MSFQVPTDPVEIRKILVDNIALSAALNDILRLTNKVGVDVTFILDRHGVKYKAGKDTGFVAKEE